MVRGLCNAYNQERSLLLLKSHYSRQFVLIFTHIFTLPNLRRAALSYGLLNTCLLGKKCFPWPTHYSSTKRSFLWNETVFGLQEHSIPSISSKLLQKRKVFILVTRNISETDAKCHDCTATSLLTMKHTNKYR